MAKYIKANKKVTEYLHLEKIRYQFADGNYLLWQNDFSVFGSMLNFSEYLKMTGSVLITSYEAKAEQEGGTPIQLPKPTDSRFIEETVSSTVSETESVGTTDGSSTTKEKEVQS